MSIDYSVFAIPKQRPKALDKAKADAELAKKDREENAKVKKRAKGQCEVRELWPLPCPVTQADRYVRCPRPGCDPHHLIYGIGRRNKGKSILAAYKLWVCRQCHDDIGAKVLKPTTAEHDAKTVRYWRAR